MIWTQWGHFISQAECVDLPPLTDEQVARVVAAATLRLDRYARKVRKGHTVKHVRPELPDHWRDCGAELAVALATGGDWLSEFAYPARDTTWWEVKTVHKLGGGIGFREATHDGETNQTLPFLGVYAKWSFAAPPREYRILGCLPIKSYPPERYKQPRNDLGGEWYKIPWWHLCPYLGPGNPALWLPSGNWWNRQQHPLGWPP